MSESEMVGRFKALCGRLETGVDDSDLREALGLAGFLIETQYNEIKKLQARVKKLEEFVANIKPASFS